MKVSGQVVNIRYITSCLFISNKNIDFKLYLYIKQNTDFKLYLHMTCHTNETLQIFLTLQWTEGMHNNGNEELR